MQKSFEGTSKTEMANLNYNDEEAMKEKIGNDDVQRKGGWNAAIFIIFVEMAERFAYYGVAGNLIMYLTNVLGQPIATAAKNVNIWMGLSSVFPLLGGFIADSYLGRFNTIVISTVIYLMGAILLTLSVSVVPLDQRQVVFFSALYLLAVGEGGHKPCVQTFAADQFDEESPKEKLAKASFFNWWYLGVVFGALLAVVVAIYVQDSISWTIGFGMLALAVAAALGVFLAGIPRYRLQIPVGSPLTKMAQVLVASARKWSVKGTSAGCSVCYDDENDAKTGVRNLARTSQFRFLEKAAMIDDIDASSETRNHWRLCSINQVEEVKLVIRLFPIWFNCMIFAIIVAQQGTFYTKQGATMQKNIKNFKIPPASLNFFTAITIIFTVIIYDRFFVPFARRFTKHPSGITMLQRMGVGMFFATVTMAVSAIVEAKRVKTARDSGFQNSPKSILPMSIFWLIPQYMLHGVADAFTIVGMQELFYDQVPEKMRSMGAAAFISTIGIGSFMSSAIIAIVQATSSRLGDKWLVDNINVARLEHFYGVLALLSGLNFVLYVWFAKGFVYKQMEADEAGKELQTAEA